MNNPMLLGVTFAQGKLIPASRLESTERIHLQIKLSHACLRNYASCAQKVQGNGRSCDATAKSSELTTTHGCGKRFQLANSSDQ